MPPCKQYSYCIELLELIGRIIYFIGRIHVKSVAGRAFVRGYGEFDEGLPLLQGYVLGVVGRFVRLRKCVASA